MIFGGSFVCVFGVFLHLLVPLLQAYKPNFKITKGCPRLLTTWGTGVT